MEVENLIFYAIDALFELVELAPKYKEFKSKHPIITIILTVTTKVLIKQLFE